MTTEDARIEVKTHGYEDNFWLVVYINGFEILGPIPVLSVADGETKAHLVKSMVREVYRRAYREGFNSCNHPINEHFRHV